LGKQVAVSFEDDLVKVVYAVQEKGKFIIQQTVTVRNDEFDAYLKSHKMPNISVVYPFRKFYSDVISAPPVKRAYLETIVKDEIRKKYPELNDFTFFYNVLTDKPSEDKGILEVFFFAVDTTIIDEIVKRFDSCGKTIKCIYPDILSLSHFVQSHEAISFKTVLCLLTTGADKTLFLVSSGQLRFIRITPSMRKDVLDTDIDNINMTVSFCGQYLRLSPEILLLLNCSINKDLTQGNTLIPAIPITHHEKLGMPEQTFREFITPLSAVLFDNDLKNDNLLPRKHKILYTQRFAVANISIFFLLFAFIAASYLMIHLSEISSLNEKIALLRKDIVGTQSVVAAYDKTSGNLQQILPMINTINDARSGSDIKKLLMELNFLPLQNIDINSMQINNKKDGVEFHLSGYARRDTLRNMHDAFQMLISNIRKNSNMVIQTQNLDLKSGQFLVEFKNRIQ